MYQHQATFFFFFLNFSGCKKWDNSIFSHSSFLSILKSEAGLQGKSLLGGGGGMSSVSGSGWRFRFCPWEGAAHLSMNSKSISLVTGLEILLHTAVEKRRHVSRVRVHEGSWLAPGGWGRERFPSQQARTFRLADVGDLLRIKLCSSLPHPEARHCW